MPPARPYDACGQGAFGKMGITSLPWELLRELPHSRVLGRQVLRDRRGRRPHRPRQPQVLARLDQQQQRPHRLGRGRGQHRQHHLPPDRPRPGLQHHRARRRPTRAPPARHGGGQISLRSGRLQRWQERKSLTRCRTRRSERRRSADSGKDSQRRVLDLLRVPGG